MVAILAAMLLAVLPLQAGPQVAFAKDLRYAESRSDLPEGDDSSDRLLDIWLPDSAVPRGGFRTVVFVHGGGFAAGDKVEWNGLNPVCRALLAKGYAVVSVNYRLKLKGTRISCVRDMKNGLPESGRYDDAVQGAIDEAAEDVSLALDWLGRFGRGYGLRTSSVALCGGSAGAVTCIEVAVSRKRSRPRIAAIINLWGAIADPGRIRRRTPPFLTIHGDSDDLINVSNALAIQERRRQLGSGQSRLIVMEGLGHAQYPYVAATYADEIDSFLRKHLIPRLP